MGSGLISLHLPLAPKRNPLLQLARKGGGGAQTQEGRGGWDCGERGGRSIHPGRISIRIWIKDF
jgi:hypothetical protein